MIHTTLFIYLIIMQEILTINYSFNMHCGHLTHFNDSYCLSHE